MATSRQVGSAPARSSRALGAAIKEARLAAGRTQIELAEMSGLNRHSMMALESGRDTKALQAVFDALAALDLELVIRPRGTS